MRFVFKTMAIGADHAGYALKEYLKQYTKSFNFELKDFGTNSEASVDYPDFAQLVCQAIIRQEVSSGILICGTGIGISMAANRFPEIRAAVCNDGVTSVKLARAHNDANVLCLGARLIGTAVAEDCLHHFLNTPFNGGTRHLKRLQKLC